jgi:hypothetical protein
VVARFPAIRCVIAASAGEVSDPGVALHQFYALVQPSLGDALSETVITVEPLIRLGCFIGVVLAMALWESLTPCRQQAIGRFRRWLNNFWAGGAGQAPKAPGVPACPASGRPSSPQIKEAGDCAVRSPANPLRRLGGHCGCKMLLGRLFRILHRHSPVEHLPNLRRDVICCYHERRIQMHVSLRDATSGVAE